MRINKLFSNYGICSRKETNRLIQENRVLINGIPAFEGQWVEESDIILFDGTRIVPKPKIYLAFNKPRGILCSSNSNLESNIISFLNYPHYIFPIGRLDKDSEGLLLLTNDGDLANDLIDSNNYHEKKYIVTVQSPITEEFLTSMSNGVKILNTITRPCILEKISDYTFSIILTQGLNRQIRRMCKTFGYTVITLQRIQILNISLSGIDYGEYRELSNSEITSLKDILKNGSE
ncbi:pseudouridine synthase [uncultured Clostridium sp.]|uniref:pseudouridine synthase n=1 Tax=uncultured Clostridium sp. TaxID=59620 RepID=UPI0026203178|nr:pseudouridine synthase [uncultured Clostridium sp.]